MKKIFLLASIAIMVLAGCSKNEVLDTPATSKAISFDSFIHKATKATPIIGEASLRGENLGLVSYRMNALVNPTGATVFFSGPLSYITKWDTNPIHYWPSTTWGNDKSESLSFFAYRPSGLAYNGDAYMANPATKPSFEYTIPNLSTNQEDILVASDENLTYESNTPNGQVNLIFNHALTQVVLMVKGQMNDLGYETTYKISSVTIGKDADANNGVLFDYGVYTYGLNWSSLSGHASYDYPILAANTNGLIGVAGYTNLGDDNAPLMLMPQDIAATTAYIHVTYTAEIGETITFDGTKKVALTAITWEPQNRVVYQLTLPSDAKPITYNVNVSPWDDNTNQPLGWE